MSHETESGFGTGLRAQLARLQESEAEPAAEPAVTEAEEALAVIVDLASEPEPAPEEPEEVSSLRAELEAALARERDLKETIEHHVEAHERELANSRDLALREAEVEQALARLETAQAELDEQKLLVTIEREQFETQRAEIAGLRTELVAEKARVDELAVQTDLRTAELVSADRERAQASSQIAHQLASIAERERELKRERAELDALRSKNEAHLATVARSVEAEREALAQTDQDRARREATLRAEAADWERKQGELARREEEIATREASLESRFEARERMLANGQARLNDWEARLREQGERLERERSGHGHASQEAFALLAELEQREQSVAERESHLLTAAEALKGHDEELNAEKDALRRREASLLAELELREDKLERRERDVAEREELIDHRERDLGAYVGELQSKFNERSVA